MNPKIVSWDGHSINDGTNYDCKIPVDTALQASQANGIFIKRAGANPVLAGAELSESYLSITIICKGAANTQLEELNKWFDIYNATPKQLIIKDTDNGDKQYYIYATPRNVSAIVGKNAVRITLNRAEPVWQSATQNSTSWAITASGQTQAITAGGNAEAFPIFEFTPTTYPTGGYGASRKVLMYPQSSYVYPYRPLEILGGLNTAALVNDTSVSNQINDVAGIDAVVTTWAIDTAVGGGLSASGMGYIGTEQISWTGKTATNIGTVVRGINGTTAAAHLDNAVIARSAVMANGDDFVVLVDGVIADRWFGETGTATFNNSATKCWINLRVPAKLNTTLKIAISAVGVPAYIEINLNTANTAAITAMPNAGRVLIGSEEFTYKAKYISASRLRLTVDERAVRNTTAAAHLANVAIIWIPYDIQIAYGNQSALAYSADDTYKPVIDMAASTNASFVYANLLDTAVPMSRRTGSWYPKLLTSAGGLHTESGVYFGEHMAADTDPAEVMGMSISTFITNGLYRAETASLECRINIPDGVSSVNSNGSKYRAKTQWATIARLQSSINGVTWVNEWAATEATPTAIATWATWTHNETVPSTTRALRFFLSGSANALAGNYYSFDVTAATIALVNYPVVTLRAAESNYYLDATITNTTTGDYITFAYPLQTGKTLYIDTDPNQPYAKFNGQITNIVNPDTNHSKWLALQAGANTLTFTSDFDSDITCVVKWRDRINFL